ncbi:nucleotidyltransferase domain-containing protein [Candidatus Aminicenantes bacterium AC-708-M15]|nr:nucleotidyltransferase domain-containing protein [SCandidatus Aminicenantes bacterium Aminicenantia_JdfR_composite]MCP2603896.1 nucleotidyltransferase domain-containing protein [Candidatus Aminicenantes bacterium AC-708-M15]
MNEKLRIAKKIIKEEVRKEGGSVLKIILFGSRAKGEFKESSDWDFFTIIDKDIDYKVRRKITMRIRRRLAKEKIFCDIIIQSQEKAEERKNNTGYITYYALKYGKVL